MNTSGFLDQYMIPALLSMLGFFLYRLINKIDRLSDGISDLKNELVEVKAEFKSMSEHVRRIDADLHSQTEAQNRLIADQNKVIEKVRGRTHLALNIVQVLLSSLELAGIKVAKGAWNFDEQTE